MSRTLGQGLKLLMVLADLCENEDGARVPLRHIAAAAEMNKSTVYRLLQSFSKYGFVESDESGAYGLGSATLLLARAAIGRNAMLAAAIPIMREIAQQTGETVSLSERRDLFNVTIYEIESTQPIRYANKLGAAAPLHISAGGRLVLAFSEPSVQAAVLSGKLERITPKTIVDPAKLRTKLTEVKKAGFAISSGERVPGTNSISVPVLQSDGYARGAMSILWPSRGNEVDRKRIATWPSMLMSAVQTLHGA
jgi:IclR family transcriptional regulator, acetate operon repressor